MEEGVQLVVAAAQRRRDGVQTVAPVQGVGVVEAERPRRRLVLCGEVKER